ncbi:MAG: hypothetical protein QNJ54_04195 [Prochloraceae cyanobacterium]|nr:hypothetical protein [Prochloraceae cyanobacterium]
MLNFNSTLGELELYQVYLEASEPIEKISNILRENPQLPGVILFKNDLLIGSLSRNSFWEYLSRRYALELCSARNIEFLLNCLDIKTFILSADNSILEATKKTLAREKNLINEPIIVKTAPKEYKLLDVSQLFVAQSKIYELTRELLNQTNKKLEE